MRFRNWERLLFETYSDYYEAPNKKYQRHMEEFGEIGESINWIGVPDKHENIQIYLWNADDRIYFMPIPQLSKLYGDDMVNLLRIPYERVYNGFLLTEEQTFTFHETLTKLQVILKEQEEFDKYRKASERRQSDLTSSLIEAHAELGKSNERADAYQTQCEEHVSYINDLEAQIEDMERVHNDLIGERDGFKNRVKELEPIVCMCHKDIACRRCRYLSHNIEDENERLKKELGVELARRDTYEQDIKRLKRETGELKKKCTDLQRFKDIHENFWTKYQKLIQTSIYEYLMGKIDEGIHPFNVYRKLLIEGRHKTCEELFRASYITYEQYSKLKYSLNKQEGEE